MKAGLSAVVAVVLVSTLVPAAADPSYVTFAVDGAQITGLGQIDDAGRTAGIYNPASLVNRGYVRSRAGTIRKVDVPGAPQTYPCCISQGSVTGFYRNSSGTFEAFLRPAVGPIVLIDVGTGQTVGTAIANGRIAGWYDDSGAPQGFVRESNGTVTRFTAPGSTQTLPSAINSRGDIAGEYLVGSVTQAFIRTAKGKIITFNVSGAKGTSALGINRSRTVTGYWWDAGDNYHGFVRTMDGTVTSFDAPGSAATSPRAINDGGSVVGVWSNFGNHGFIRTPDGTITNIDVPGATSTGALSINKSGEVGGIYQFADPVSGTTKSRAFIRMP